MKTRMGVLGIMGGMGGRLGNRRSPMADRRWPMAEGRWPMAEGRWPIANRRWPRPGVIRAFLLPLTVLEWGSKRAWGQGDKSILRWETTLLR